MATKVAKLSSLLLVFTFFLVSATLSLAKQDPELLQQCKHQCSRLQHKQQLCEQRCEEYYREKQEQEKEHDEWNVVEEDPRKQLRRCQSQCEKQEGWQREQCQRRCVEKYREQQEEEGGRGQGNKRDPQEQFRQCRQQCQQQEEGQQQQRRCERRCEEQLREQEGSTRQEEQEQQDNNPYVFEEQHFTTRAKTQEGRVRVLQRFSERSELLRGIDNYRIALLEANPQTFIIPHHCDAESIFFVVKGRGTISSVSEDSRESVNIRRGDIMRIRAGTTVYMINRDNKEKLSIAKLIQPISVPGEPQAFFGAGGEDPESFYRAFSTEILEAALNTPKEKWQKLFGQQKQGSIIKASEEQIKAMSQQEEGGIWPFGGESKGPFNLFKKRPSQSNHYGQLFEANSNDYKELRDLDVAISFANITKGSMEAPFYNSRATKISIVVEGQGYFEMACPHLSSSGPSGRHGGQQGGGSSQQHQTRPSYQKVTARLKRGVVFVVPAGHPVVAVASNDQNLQVLCFEINAQNNHKFPLAGKRNIINQLEKEAKELAFNVPAKEVEEIFKSQHEEIFFPGPRRQQREGGRAYA